MANLDKLSLDLDEIIRSDRPNNRRGGGGNNRGFRGRMGRGGGGNAFRARGGGGMVCLNDFNGKRFSYLSFF